MKDFSKEYTILEKKELPRENIAFLFASDLHIDPYLLHDAQGELTVYEGSEGYGKRVALI